MSNNKMDGLYIGKHARFSSGNDDANDSHDIKMASMRGWETNNFETCMSSAASGFQNAIERITLMAFDITIFLAAGDGQRT